MEKKTKDGVILKKHQIHRLHTDQATVMWLTEHNVLMYSNSPQKALTNQHLYITSDEEIKEGDWFMSVIRETMSLNEHSTFANSIHKADKVVDGSLQQWKDGKIQGGHGINNPYLACKKIVATTNPEILLLVAKPVDKGLVWGVQFGIAKIPKDFIEAYIKAYNEGHPITEVMLEYVDNGHEVDMEGVGGEDIGWMSKVELNLRSDGSVIIHRVKETQTWAEIWTEYCKYREIHSEVYVGQFLEWLEKNYQSPKRII